MMENHENTLKIDENPIYSFNAESAKISLSLGNSKMGNIINWSTLPGNSEHMLIAKGRLITDIEGTCSTNCNGCFKNCYARRSILQHHNSITKPWAENTLMIRFNREACFDLIDKKLRTINKKFYESGDIKDLAYKFFRINTSGELQSVEELEAWDNLARLHPEMRFGIYSKNSAVLLEFFRRHGQTADNFCINVSEWNGCMSDTIAKLRAMGAKFNVFEYDSSNTATSQMTLEEKIAQRMRPHCPAVGATKENKHPINPATGEVWHCSECRGCYTKTGTHRYVYSH